jgi:hypothetical protein
MPHEDLVGAKLQEWTAGGTGKDAMVAIYNKIRDIPYGILPELNDPVNYLDILEIWMGSCTPKHLLLCNMYERLGLNVLYSVYPYRWAEFEELYPKELWKLALKMAPAHHLACRVEINSRWVLVDATVDPPLGRIGLPVNVNWDGEADTLLPVLPTGEEELYYPSEASLMPPPDVDANARAFYQGLNTYFQEIRDGKY